MSGDTYPDSGPSPLTQIPLDIVSSDASSEELIGDITAHLDALQDPDLPDHDQWPEGAKRFLGAAAYYLAAAREGLEQSIVESNTEAAASAAEEAEVEPEAILDIDEFEALVDRLGFTDKEAAMAEVILDGSNFRKYPKQADYDFSGIESASAPAFRALANKLKKAGILFFDKHSADTRYQINRNSKLYDVNQEIHEAAEASVVYVPVVEEVVVSEPTPQPRKRAPRPQPEVQPEAQPEAKQEVPVVIEPSEVLIPQFVAPEPAQVIKAPPGSEEVNQDVREAIVAIVGDLLHHSPAGNVRLKRAAVEVAAVYGINPQTASAWIDALVGEGELHTARVGGGIVLTPELESSERQSTASTPEKAKVAAWTDRDGEVADAVFERLLALKSVNNGIRMRKLAESIRNPDEKVSVVRQSIRILIRKGYVEMPRDSHGLIRLASKGIKTRLLEDKDAVIAEIRSRVESD